MAGNVPSCGAQSPNGCFYDPVVLNRCLCLLLLLLLSLLEMLVVETRQREHGYMGPSFGDTGT